MMTTAMMDLFSTAGFSTLISWLTLGDVSTVGTLPHKPSNSTGHGACVFISIKTLAFWNDCNVLDRGFLCMLKHSLLSHIVKNRHDIFGSVC